MILQLEEGDIAPWWMEGVWAGTDPAPSVMVADQNWLALPEDFQRETDDGEWEVQGYPATSPLTWTTLEKGDYYTLRRADKLNTAEGIPRGYALFGDRVYFSPMPDVNYIFTVPYYKRSVPVTDDDNNVSNPWLRNAYNYTTLLTLNLIAQTHVRDEKLAGVIGPQLQFARDQFQAGVEAREHAARQYLLTNEES